MRTGYAQYMRGKCCNCPALQYPVHTYSKLHLGIFGTTAHRMQKVLVQQVFYERTNSIAECLRVESISSHLLRHMSSA